MQKLPSNTQLDKLGARLAKADVPSPEDLRLLHAFRAAHLPALAAVVSALEGLGLRPTSRPKTPETIIDKLRRGPTRLTTIQDIVGARIVPDVTLDEQDAVVTSLTRQLGGQVQDRRDRPHHGYRAVHVVVEAEGRRVEIQVRTPLQDLWAQVMEHLGDRLGRGIRYGWLPPDEHRRTVVTEVIALSSAIAAHEEQRARVARVDADVAQLDPLDRPRWAVSETAARHASLKAILDTDELSFRGALTFIRDALGEGEVR